MTAAAMTLSSVMVPVTLAAAFSRAVMTIAPSADNVPITTKMKKVMRFTSTPASSALSGLPPIA